MIFFHKYYLFNLMHKLNFEYDNDNLILLCISCYFLATKSLNYLINIDDIINIIYKNNILKNNNNNLKEKYKKLIFNYEFNILESIGFNIDDFISPYKYISFLFDKIIIKFITDISILKNLKEYFTALINYSYIFPFFLKFNTLTIVLSLLKYLFNSYSIKIDINKIILEFGEYGPIHYEIEEKECYKFIDLIFSNEKNKFYNNININMDILHKIKNNITNSDIQYEVNK